MRTFVQGLLIFSSLLFSGYTLFETTVGEQHCYDEGISVLSAENGGWLVSGAYNCEGNPKAWKSSLNRLNAQGDTLSIAKDLPYNGILKSMPDGNLVFAGGNRAGFTYDTAMIFKVTPAGTLLWEKKLFQQYCNHLLTDILPLNDGFLVTGISAQASCTSPVYDSYIAKLDTAGELLWKHDVTGDGNEQLHVLRLIKDGNIAAFGWTENKSSADDADYLLVKLDPNGNEIWSKTFGDDQDNYGYGMDITLDNGFILNGHSTSMEIMRVDENGTLLWSKYLTEACGGRYFKAYAGMDGGFVFLGTEQSSSQCKSALIKTNCNGEVFWKKHFTGVVRSVTESQPGRYALTGYKSYLPQLYVAVFDTTALTKEENEDQVQTIGQIAYPVFANEIDTTEELVTTGIKQPDETIKSPKVYPNPSESIVNIEFENKGHYSCQLKVFDTGGKLVLEETTTSGRFIVDSKSIARGIYTYHLNSTGKIFYGKILFQ